MNTIHSKPGTIKGFAKESRDICWYCMIWQGSWAVLNFIFSSSSICVFLYFLYYFLNFIFYSSSICVFLYFCIQAVFVYFCIFVFVRRGRRGWAVLNFIFYSNSQQDTFASSEEYKKAQLITRKERNHSGQRNLTLGHRYEVSK